MENALYEQIDPDYRLFGWLIEHQYLTYEQATILIEGFS